MVDQVTELTPHAYATVAGVVDVDAHALDWPSLRVLIDGGDVAGVAAAVRGIGDPGRQELIGPLEEYAQAGGGSGEESHDALTVAMVGCGTTVAALASWACERTLEGPGERRWVLDVLRAREDRLTLLDGCVEVLMQGVYWVYGYVSLYHALAPSLDEVVACTPRWRRLLTHETVSVVEFAQAELRRLVETGRLDLEVLVEAGRTVLPRKEKKLVHTQLSTLDVALRGRRWPAGEILRVVATAFAHRAADIQQQAVNLVVTYIADADDRCRADLAAAAAALPADLRQAVAGALGVEVSTPPGPAAVPAPAAPARMPAPIRSVDELVEVAEGLLGETPGPVELERLLAAVVGFGHTDRDGVLKALEPVLAGAGFEPGRSRATFNDPAEFLDASLAAVLGGGAAVTPHRWDGGWVDGPLVPPVHVIAMRLREIAAGLATDPRPALVATPSLVTGVIDPPELVDRLARAAAEGWHPWEYDLQQALLRLPRDADPDGTLADRARMLGTLAGDRLAGWLDGGGLPDPVVTPVRREVYTGHYGSAVQPWPHLVATVRPAGNGPAPELAGLLCELPEPVEQIRQHNAWASCWLPILPSHRDVTAAHLLPYLFDLTWETWADDEYLIQLAEAGGPVGPATRMAIGYGMAGKTPSHRAAGVDAALVLAGRGQLDGVALGVDVAALVVAGAAVLGRIVDSLRDLTTGGAQIPAWAAVSAALPRLLPPAVAKAAPKLADLVAFGVELAGMPGVEPASPAPCRPDPADDALVPALAAVTAGGRLGTEARRLHRMLT